jgi:prepilin-type N-terminal cleavage/methylation domain-containing protein
MSMTEKRIRPGKQGFTLVELAIVLVIIGLLIGGILVAQSMIATVKIQRQIRDILQYEIAINNFKNNYRYYPGDALQFTPPGDGNNKLDYAGGSPGGCIPPNYSNNESVQAFGHLTQAKMISTNYVPFTPIACGGSMSNTPSASAGVIAPYTELDTKAAAYLGVSKFLISPFKGVAAANLYLQLILSVSNVVPLEAKLGSAPSLNSTVGLSNPAGQGNCLTNQDDVVSCTANNAVYGQLQYWLNPL